MLEQEVLNRDTNYIIETKNLTKQYGSQKSVADLNIHVKRGRIYGLLGRNISLLIYLIYYLNMKIHFGLNDNVFILFHISAVISILAIIGLAADSIHGLEMHRSL